MTCYNKWGIGACGCASCTTTICVQCGGDPVDGDSVTISLDGTTIDSGTTDGSGCVTLTIPSAGSYTVDVTGNGHADSTAVRTLSCDGVTNVQVCCFVSVCVKAPCTGTDFAGATVNIGGNSCTTDASGCCTVELPGDVTGTYAYSISGTTINTISGSQLFICGGVYSFNATIKSPGTCSPCCNFGGASGFPIFLTDANGTYLLHPVGGFPTTSFVCCYTLTRNVIKPVGGFCQTVVSSTMAVCYTVRCKTAADGKNATWSAVRNYTIGGDTFTGDCWFAEDTCTGGGTDTGAGCGSCRNGCPGGCTPQAGGTATTSKPFPCADFTLTISMVSINCGLTAWPVGPPQLMNDLVGGDVVVSL